MAKDSYKIAIIMGSDSDWEVMERCFQQLQEFGIPTDVQVRSAHRTPEAVTAYVTQAEKDGVRVFIAAAGMAAALPGVVAAHTTRPVIGVPLVSGALAGVDALLSIVQMPPAYPSPRSPSGLPGPEMPPCSPLRSWPRRIRPSSRP